LCDQADAEHNFIGNNAMRRHGIQGSITMSRKNQGPGERKRKRKKDSRLDQHWKRLTTYFISAPVRIGSLWFTSHSWAASFASVAANYSKDRCYSIPFERSEVKNQLPRKKMERKVAEETRRKRKWNQYSYGPYWIRSIKEEIQSICMLK
jgi:hypothetical protein